MTAAAAAAAAVAGGGAVVCERTKFNRQTKNKKKTYLNIAERHNK